MNYVGSGPRDMAATPVRDTSKRPIGRMCLAFRQDHSRFGIAVRNLGCGCGFDLLLAGLPIPSMDGLSFASPGGDGQGFVAGADAEYVVGGSVPSDKES